MASGVPLYLQGKGRGKGKGRGRPISRDTSTAFLVPPSSSLSTSGVEAGSGVLAGRSGRARARSRGRASGHHSGVGVPDELSAMTVSCGDDNAAAAGQDRETGRNTHCAPAARPAHNPEPWPPVGWDPYPLRTAITSAGCGGTTLSENAGEISTLESTAANLARKGLWADAARAQVAAIELVQRAQRMAGTGTGDETGTDTEWTDPFEQNLAICTARARAHAAHPAPPTAAPAAPPTGHTSPASRPLAGRDQRRQLSRGGGGGGGSGRGGRGQPAPTIATTATTASTSCLTPHPPSPPGHTGNAEDDDDTFLIHVLELSAQLAMAGTLRSAAEAGPASTSGRWLDVDDGSRGSADWRLLAEQGVLEDADGDNEAEQLALVIQRSMLSYAEESGQPS